MGKTALVDRLNGVALNLMIYGGFILITIRPLDWIKNLLVFAPVFFSGEAKDMNKLLLVSLVFLAFNAMSGAVYVFNDLLDRERDKLHPIKRERPIASGALPLRVAMISACLLAACSLLLVCFSLPVTGALLAYSGLNVLYSTWLKHMVILDVFSVSLGFVLRVFAGGMLIDVKPSSWLIMTTFLLSLVLVLGKRRQELLAMKDAANILRPVLEQYTIDLIDKLMSIVIPVTLITYLLYTLDAATIARFHSQNLYLTGIFVTFGIFRYLYLVHRKDLGVSPTELVITDPPLRNAVLGWIVSFALIIYIGLM